MNARLNAELVGVELEVKKMSDYQTEMTFERQQMQLEEGPELDVKLEEIEGINKFVVDSLIDAGFDTPRKILNALPQDLSKGTGISKEMIDDVLEKIRKIKA